MIHDQTRAIHFRQVTAVLRRRWKLIAGWMFGGMLLAIVIGAVSSPRYTAKVHLLVAKSDVGPLQTLDTVIVDTHVALIKSPAHLRRVQASLAQDSAIRPEFSFEEIQEKLNVYKELHSRVIAVTFTAGDPSSAATVANRIAGLYVERMRERIRQRRETLEKSLDESIPSAQAALDHAEAAVRDHRIAFGLVDGNSADLLDRQIAELKRHLAKDVAALDRSNARLALLPGSREDESPSGVTAANGVYGTRIQEDAVEGESDREALERRRNHIRQRLEALERSRESMQEAETRLRELERAAAASARVYEGLLRRKTELAAGEAGDEHEAHVVSAATPPDRPSSPAPILFIVPALMAFAIAGGATAFILEHFDSRLRSESDVEEALGIPCIGLVPNIPGAATMAAQRALIDNPFDSYSDSIRGLVMRALAQRQRPGHDPAVFSVTSSEQGDGKTTLAISLAVSAAQMGRQVLLIDFDFRNPGPHPLGDLGAPAPGDAEGVSEPPIQRLAELGIAYLPLSRMPEAALGLISTNQAAQLLGRLKRQHDCIVVDCPPLLGGTEAHLAGLADAVFFAVRWGYTTADAARQALVLLARSGGGDLDGRVNAVVTRVNMREHVFGRYGQILAPAPLAARADLPPPRRA